MTFWWQARQIKNILQDIRAVCSRPQDSGLVIKLEKCLFGHRFLDFLGHKVFQFGSIPLPEKVKAITDFPKPSTTKGLQELLGMINFYHRFIPHAASHLLPLNDALHKTQTQQIISWTAEMEGTFTSCKAALAQATMLSRPSPMYRSLLPQTPLTRRLEQYSFTGYL